MNALIDAQLERLVEGRSPVPLLRIRLVNRMFGRVKSQAVAVDDVWPLDVEVPATGPIEDARSSRAPADRSTRIAVSNFVGTRQWGSVFFTRRIVPIRFVDGQLFEARDVVLDFRHDDPKRSLEASATLLDRLSRA